MGLDWIPLPRPKAGCEREFERLVARIDEDWDSPAADERARRLRELSVDVGEELGVPRIGFDAAADEYLREHLRRKGQADQYEQKREEHRGSFVFQLIEPCDGIPKEYASAFTSSPLDFRGEYLRSVEDVIGEDLLERAWHTMNASEVLAYADALEAKLRPWAQRVGCSDLDALAASSRRELTEDGAKAHVLVHVIRYCRFWGSRGHGIEVWF